MIGFYFRKGNSERETGKFEYSATVQAVFVELLCLEGRDPDRVWSSVGTYTPR